MFAYFRVTMVEKAPSFDAKTVKRLVRIKFLHLSTVIVDKCVNEYVIILPINERIGLVAILLKSLKY